MQLKYEQKLDEGTEMNDPPQNVYPQGLAAAPQVFAVGACVRGGAVGAGVLVAGRGVASAAVGASVATGAALVDAAVAGGAVIGRGLAALVWVTRASADRLASIALLSAPLGAEHPTTTIAIAPSASPTLFRNTTRLPISRASDLVARVNHD
jgi:hypothetical protein